MKISELNPLENPLIIQCEGSSTAPLEELIDFQGGLKTLSPDNREKLARTMIENGFTAPVFIWEKQGTKYILDGHQRLKTLNWLKRKGWSIPEIPTVTVYAENEKDARRKLLGIASQYGDFDIDTLTDWITEVDDEIKESIRFLEKEIELPEDEEPIETDGDDEIEEEVEPVTKLGDLWELGSHRLLCGDSTDFDTVERLMDGQKADMVFTDPPYGVDYDGGHATGKRRDKLENDDKTDMYDLPVKNAFLFSTKEAPLYLWFADRFSQDVINGLETAGYSVRNWIIWNKNVAQFGAIGAQYKSKHEPCIYAVKKGKVNWCGPTNETTVWDISRDHINEHHPTQKPIALSQRAFKNHSVGRVLDLFGGSGSTLISSEKNNKISFLMELDPHYCDVIVNRYKTWCEKNGHEYKILLNGEEWGNDGEQ